MIFAAAVFLGLLAAIITALRLNAATDRARRRFRVLAGQYRDAAVLVAVRRRIRKRQKSVESALDSGTAGVQSAHRTLSGLWGWDVNRGAGVYDGVRTFNRSVGRAVSGLLAPKPRKRNESLGDPHETKDDRNDD